MLKKYKAMRRIILSIGLILILLSSFSTPAQAIQTQNIKSWLPFYGRSTTGCSFETCTLNPARHQDLIDLFGDTDYHPYPAIDFNLPYGFPIRATADGVVVLQGHETDNNPNAFPRRPGRFIVLEHQGQPLSTYKHLSRSMVNQGESVVLGQVIGLVGNTQSPNVHLHFDRQNTVADFNLYSNQASLSNLYYRNGTRLLSVGARVAPRTVINGGGWSSAPFVVRNETQLRNAITRMHNGTLQGPFIVRVQGTITLTTSLNYSNNNLLIIEGPGKLISPVGQRILNVTGTGPVELKGIQMNARSNLNGSLVYSSSGKVILNNTQLSGHEPRIDSDIEVEQL